MKRGNESKPHIGIYGKCNAGKSTLLNFLIGEHHAIVSAQKGTTTDPVRKSIEILDFAPVIAIDTAGLDDNTELGEQRKRKSLETLYHIDLAIIIYRGEWSSLEINLLSEIKKQGLAYIIINNIFDNDNCLSTDEKKVELDYKINEKIIRTTLSSENERNEIFEAIKKGLPNYSYVIPSMFSGKSSENDVVLLVCPIDSEAPAGRLILPQVQAIRDLLDRNSIAIVVQPQQVKTVLSTGLNIKLVVVDSQILADVKPLIDDKKIGITTFSILLAELKGDVDAYKKGLEKVDELKNGDKILIMENCLHQTSCEDIGRVKIPKWLNEYKGFELEYDIISGLTPLPDNLESYALVVQCGGCMVTPRQLKGRISRVLARGVAITNYGMLIKKIR